MNIFIIFFIYHSGYFISNQKIFVSGEYNVKDVVPSYLYHKFENVKENIFPQDLRIKISLSRIAGTLLYTIDKNMNQMIVTLHDGLSITLGIEFRKKEIFINLFELCDCDRCRYETWDIRIEIRDKINVQCNIGSMKSYPYESIIEINPAYNIPKYDTSINKTLTNEGHLWLVNTPYDTGIYPNPNQLEGCIFNVWYENNPVVFKQISGNIAKSCRMLCKDNICNGGECYETYNGSPLCNCTKTFKNGEFCNETISQVNIQSMKQLFQFQMFKLSWNSSSNDILEISNPKFQIRICAVERLLKFEYHYMKDYRVNITSILSHRYKANKRHILIAIFEKTFIDIHYFNVSWSRKTLPSVLDLRKEEITSISLQSGDGQISLAFKNNPKYLAWNVIKITDYEEIMISKTGKNINSTMNMFKLILSAFQTDKKVMKKLIEENMKAVISITILVPIFLVVATILFFKFYKRNSRKTYGSQNSRNADEETNKEMLCFTEVGSSPDQNPGCSQTSKKETENEISNNEIFEKLKEILGILKIEPSGLVQNIANSRETNCSKDQNNSGHEL